MTLQEKIDKLPLSIEYNGRVYNLRICTYKENIYLEYRFDDVQLFGLTDDRILLKTSFRLEELIDKALKAINDKVWED